MFLFRSMPGVQDPFESRHVGFFVSIGAQVAGYFRKAFILIWLCWAAIWLCRIAHDLYPRTRLSLSLQRGCCLIIPGYAWVSANICARRAAFRG